MNDNMYAFISHKGNRKEWPKIHKMCKELDIEKYIIVVGDAKKKGASLRGRIFTIPSGDGYCDLPEKMYKLCKYFLEFFPKEKGFLKIDDDVRLYSQELYKILEKHNAGTGYITTSSPEWHMGRCPGSEWNKKKMNWDSWSKKYLKYTKKFRIMGGSHTYYLSKRAIKAIVKTIEEMKINPKTHVLENVMISSILAKKGIKPVLNKSLNITMEEIYKGNKKLANVNTKL